MIARRRGRPQPGPQTTRREEQKVREQVPEGVSAELAGAWRRVRDDLRESLPDSTFRLWLEPLRVVAARGSTLYLTGPAKVRSWVERRYSDLLDEAIEGHATFDEIRFVDEEGGDRPREARQPRGGVVNPELSFERFVIGPANRLAHAAALSVAEAPGQAYNPLFLHGDPGLGKTHLLCAIGNYLRSHSPQLSIHYTTAERFTNDFVAALQSSAIDCFKDAYRGADVLLLDDVQFLEGKTRTADELFHTFNALHERGAQIVLSADRIPSELSELATRLRDRFEWGLVAELRGPDELTRITFLNRLSREEELDPAEPEALGAIARRGTGNLRLLRGALTRVVAYSSLTDAPITRRLVEQALPGAGPPPSAPKPVPVAEIQDAACEQLGVSREQLLSPSRVGSVVEARQLAMYLTRDLTELSLPQIARAFERRDHTTVMHALKRVESRLLNEPTLIETLEGLRSALATGATQDGS